MTDKECSLECADCVKICSKKNCLH